MSDAAALAKQLRREKKANKRLRAKLQAAANERQRAKVERRNQLYIPAQKRRLPEYQPGVVVVLKTADVGKTENIGVVDPASDEFLRSYEWRRVRMEALKRYGAKCQCCGATPQTGAKINVDHIKPRRVYPELALSIDNLQVLCHDCNHGKGNWDMTDWRAKERSPA